MRYDESGNDDVLEPSGNLDHTAMRLPQRGRAGLLKHGGGAYRGYAGGCPAGNLIKPRDYSTSMEGVPVDKFNADLCE
jgi:hypothetical protein